MNMRFKRVDKLEARAEKIFATAGANASRPFHARVREIIAKLSKTFPITGMQMGMGGWWLKGPEVAILFDDGSEGTASVQELLDDWGQMPDRMSWEPKLGNTRHLRLLQELYQLLSYLNDERWMETIDLP